MAGNSSLSRRKGLNPGCGKKRYEDELAAKLALAGNGRQDSAGRHESSTDKEPRECGRCGKWHLEPVTASLRRTPRAASKPGAPRKAPRDTGPDGKTRAIVFARFGGRCAGCGRPLRPGDLMSCQHIVARGVGGTNDLDILVYLCGTATMPSDACHPRCERREAEMHRRGLWRKSTEPPRPIELWDGRRVWLAADGGYADAPPEEEAA